MTAPCVPVPIPIGSSTNFTINKNQRRSSLENIAACSDLSKEQFEESSKSNFKKMSVPDDIGSTSSSCNSPLVRTKCLGMNTSMEYCTQSLEETEQNTDLAKWEDRPTTPTILGYEVMEERAKFTVYKILVKKTLDENWVVFRRYTDFSRLNDKLKDMFPGFRLSLPPKRWFKDNYNADFLEDRVLGLQAFLQNLVAHKDISNCIAVREFLCLDDPPGPFDSLEESRAFCETLEETNYQLQKELIEKQNEVETLKALLNEKEMYINEMERRIGDLNLMETNSRKLSGEESECSGEVESSSAEADQSAPEEDNRSEQEKWKKSWSGSSVENFIPEIEVAEVAYTADVEM